MPRSRTFRDLLAEWEAALDATAPRGTAEYAARVIAALYADDGTTLSRLKAESATNPNLRVTLYNGASKLAPIAAMPGASEVKTIAVSIAATSATRATALTPTAGKKVRIIAIIVGNTGQTTNGSGWTFYFGTGASIETTPANAIAILTADLTGSYSIVFPDGAGPIGAVDAVVSQKTNVEVEGNNVNIIIYREE